MIFNAKFTKFFFTTTRFNVRKGVSLSKENKVTLSKTSLITNNLILNQRSAPEVTNTVVLTQRSAP